MNKDPNFNPPLKVICDQILDREKEDPKGMHELRKQVAKTYRDKATDLLEKINGKKSKIKVN